MKLTRFETNAAVSFLTALPNKSESGRLSGKTLAAVAVATAILAEHGRQYNSALETISEKVKPEGFDKRYAERKKVLDETFPEGTEFNAEKWAEVSDPEFESTLIAVNKEFGNAKAELDSEIIDVDLKLTSEHFAEISEVISGVDKVSVDGKDLPVMGYLSAISVLFE